MKPSGPCRRKRRWCDWLEGTPSAQIKQAISRAPLPEHAGCKKILVAEHGITLSHCRRARDAFRLFTWRLCRLAM